MAEAVQKRTVHQDVQTGLVRLVRRLQPLAPGRYIVVLTKRLDGLDYSVTSAGKVEG